MMSGPCNGGKRVALSRPGLCLDSLLDWARGKGRILIIIHDHPDPDCLASAMALRHLFTMKLARDADIAFSGMIHRRENSVMAKELQIPLIPMASLKFRDYSMVCMLDTQPGTGNNSLPPGARVDLVIDHHPMREASGRCRWIDIREDYGATATILYEYLVAQDIPFGTKLATALFYAIKSETQDLGREAGKADRDAYLRLFPLTNKKLLYEITQPKLPVEHFRVIYSALRNGLIYGNVLVVTLGGIGFPEAVAEVADFLVRLEGVETVMCMGICEDAMVLSMRTERHDLNAGEVMIRLVAGEGSAGGHGMMAGGRIEIGSTDPEEALRIEESLTNRLISELGLGAHAPRCLIGSM